MNRIGIDLGGTKIEIILTPPDSIEPLFKKRIPTEQEKGYENILDKLAGLIREAAAQSAEDFTLGIGIPGSISPFSGKIRNANTQCLNGRELKEDLEAKTGRRATVGNDANCLALSEAAFGAGRGFSQVAAVILGTGMGGGIVLDGKLLEGHHGNAGEWGHYSLDMEGAPCWCGNRGCMELYLSGTGFQRLHRERTGENKTAQEIHALHAQGDTKAKETMKEYLDYFGRGIADMVMILDPDVIVLGGGMSNLSELYDEGVAKVREYLFDDQLEARIVRNRLGDSSGIYGALLLPGMGKE